MSNARWATCKIRRLVADDRAAAEAIMQALLASADGGEVFLDVPAVDRGAIALAEALGLKPVFETARIYTGASRRCASTASSA